MNEAQKNLKLAVMRMLESDETFIKHVEVGKLDEDNEKVKTVVWSIEAYDNRDEPGL